MRRTTTNAKFGTFRALALVSGEILRKIPFSPMSKNWTLVKLTSLGSSARMVLGGSLSTLPRLQHCATTILWEENPKTLVNFVNFSGTDMAGKWKTSAYSLSCSKNWCRGGLVQSPIDWGSFWVPTGAERAWYRPRPCSGSKLTEVNEVNTPENHLRTTLTSPKFYRVPFFFESPL